MKAYQIKIMIKGAKPPVWRRISLPATFTFAQLHESIQILFGWMNYHSYEFEIPKYDVSIMDTEDEMNDLYYHTSPLEAYATTLKEYFHEGLRLTYTYDFGDVWHHSILVEKEIDQEEDYPILQKWKGDNFAEDAGNVHGYYEICKIANTSDHPECNAMKEWLQMQHHDFLLDEVCMRLQDIHASNGMSYISELNSAELNHALSALKKVILDKPLDDVITLTIKKDRESKMATITEHDNIYSLQIYENEELYFHGVEFANPNSTFNIYANCFLVLISDHPLSLGDGWYSIDKCSVVKVLKTGYLPLDIQNKDVPVLVEYLYDIADIYKKSKRFPDKQMFEHLYATYTNQTWNLRIKTLQYDIDVPEFCLTSRTQSELKQLPAYPYDVRIDLVAIPKNNGLNLSCIIEDEHQTSEFCIERINTHTFEALNGEIFDHVCDFIKQHGIMKSIEVACENMGIMLRALCKDLHIPLRIRNFVTDYEQDFRDEVVDKNLQYLDMLEQLSEDELNDFIEQMDEEDFATLEFLIKQYVEEDDDDDDDEQPSTPKFDA